jgi:hypothetical protein
MVGQLAALENNSNPFYKPKLFMVSYTYLFSKLSLVVSEFIIIFKNVTSPLIVIVTL